MRTYKIDFAKLAKDLLPHFLQKSQILVWVTGDNFAWVTAQGQAWVTGTAVRHVKWLGALVAPLESLNALFRDYVADIRYSMYMTGQVVYLEHLLNDIYDSVARRIYIEDGDATQPMLLYNKAETPESEVIRNKAEGGVDSVLYNRAEAFGQVDFVVVLPFGEIPDFWDAQIRANINKYKLAGKRYRIDITPGGPIVG